MKYMTFNSSCSYAGVANMLEQYGVNTDDRSIALRMKLPYLFSFERGVYMSGPMLQSADWFNLYLNPIGFEMTETEMPSAHVPEFLKRQKTAMIGMQVSENDKHAVVYTGSQDGKLVFLNNKWEQDSAPNQFWFTDTEIVNHLESLTMVATLKQIDSKEVDLRSRLAESISVIQQNLYEIKSLCARQETVARLRSMLNTLFRPLFLDGITMLNLLGKVELANQFSHIQKGFLNAIRQDPNAIVFLGDNFAVSDLVDAVGEYTQLIAEQIILLRE